MNILHLSSEKTWRGGEQQIAYLIEELTNAGGNCCVAVREGSVFQDYCRKKGIQHFPLAFKSSVDLPTANAVKSICRKLKIDIVHMHSSKSHSIGVLSAVLGNSTPLILSRRVDFVPKNSWFTKWKYNHKAIKRVLCVSEKINEIMRSYLKEPQKSMTVHSGVDLDKFNTTTTNRKNILRSEFNIDTDSILIGNTSALEDHKDYPTFIDTIDILIKRKLPVHAFIIGKGSLESSLKSYAAEKGLNHRMIFTGFRNDVIEILPELDIFLMTSKEEGLGTSILDAFLAGPVVVATKAGGIPEMVIHEKTGLLAPVGDAATLADNIEKIITQKDLRKKLSLGAREKVKEFSKEVTAAKTLDVYKDVIAKQ